jgi:alpha-L-rhamnosidase
MDLMTKTPTTKKPRTRNSIPANTVEASPQAGLKEAAAYILTPSSDRALPVAVVRTEGRIEAAEALLREDGESCRLIYEQNGPKPVVVLDFGKQSVAGYAVFTVAAKTGQPVVRLAYACHPDGLPETGCFSRETSARYLGPTFDLPVLPGNINRHETYTIPRTGRFIAPLIQGQTRYILLQLDTPDTSVDIDAVVMVNSKVCDLSPHDGFFLCSDERLNRLWAISTWTLQIASFPNHDAWKCVDGWLLPRKLEQADDVGLSVAGADWTDVVIETVFELRANPHHISAAGMAFRARDAYNAYLAEIALDGTFRLLRRQQGTDTLLCGKRLAAPLTDGTRYSLTIEARGPNLTTRLDGMVIDETRDTVFATGRVGFYTPKEKWPLFECIRVLDGKGVALLTDDFSGDLSQWQFARTLSFVADGAKRDRLVWSGDLYFAQESAYYAFAHPTYLRDSLKMLAFNQTPEGYVHASPYPERCTPPPSGDYGPFRRIRGMARPGRLGPPALHGRHRHAARALPHHPEAAGLSPRPHRRQGALRSACRNLQARRRSHPR